MQQQQPLRQIQRTQDQQVIRSIAPLRQQPIQRTDQPRRDIPLEPFLEFEELPERWVARKLCEVLLLLLLWRPARVFIYVYIVVIGVDTAALVCTLGGRAALFGAVLPREADLREETFDLAQALADLWAVE